MCVVRIRGSINILHMHAAHALLRTSQAGAHALYYSQGPVYAGPSTGSTPLCHIIHTHVHARAYAGRHEAKTHRHTPHPYTIRKGHCGGAGDPTGGLHAEREEKKREKRERGGGDMEHTHRYILSWSVDVHKYIVLVRGT